MAYLDASAIVRIVAQEPGRDALIDFLRPFDALVTSGLSSIEAPRAVARKRPDLVAAAERFLADIGQVALAGPIVARAARLGPPSLRSLDAVHLATAVELGSDLAAFVTYDARLAEAAAAASVFPSGVEVAAPG